MTVVSSRALSRRRIPHAASAAEAVAPIGLAMPSVFAGNRVGALPAELAAPPGCLAAASFPVTVLPDPRVVARGTEPARHRCGLVIITWEART
jgi:hypothetical protein